MQSLQAPQNSVTATTGSALSPFCHLSVHCHHQRLQKCETKDEKVTFAQNLDAGWSTAMSGNNPFSSLRKIAKTKHIALVIRDNEIVVRGLIPAMFVPVAKS